MNVEMIGIENAKISDVFENYEYLIDNVSKFIQSNLDTFCTSINHSYQSFKLETYPNDYISIEIQGIYENGIIIRIIAHRDHNTYHDAICTSGLLIIKENEYPKFIIDSISSLEKENEKFKVNNKSNIFIKINQNEVELEINKLGKRIDEKYVGKEKPNVFNSVKRQQYKNNIMKEKIKLVILKSIENLEHSKKTSIIPIKKQNINKKRIRYFKYFK